jgi:hypothetical protein
MKRPIKLFRGGSWYDDFDPDFYRSAFRNQDDVLYQFYSVGFRIVIGGVSRENMEDSEGQRLEQQT